MIQDKIIFVESKIPLEDHKHLGWFWHVETQNYYRWNDIPYGNSIK